jgi:hypothetical protein
MGTSTNAEGFKITYNDSDTVIGNVTSTPLRVVIGNSEKARIDGSGRLLVGTVTAPPMTAAGDVAATGAFCTKSPNGTWWSISVEDNGQLTVSPLV